MEYQNEQQKTTAGKQKDPTFQVSWSNCLLLQRVYPQKLTNHELKELRCDICHVNCAIYKFKVGSTYDI